MKEALEKFARDLLRLSLTEGLTEKQKAAAAVLLLDKMATIIEKEYLGYGE